MALGLFALMLAGACVPRSHYEEVRSAAEVEQRARLQAAERLAELERQLALAQAKRASQDAELERREQALSESELYRTVLAKERDHAAELVDQLRGEVARAGDHLQVFAEQKKDLAGALEDAEARAGSGAAKLVPVVRDVSLLLHEPLSLAELELGEHQGQPVLKLPYQPKPATKELVAALVRLQSLHPNLHYRISGQHMQRVADELSAQGLAGRLSTAEAEEPQGLEVLIDFESLEEPAQAVEPAAQVP